MGEVGGLADTSGFAADFDLGGASCCEVRPVGLCDALYTSTAAGSARIFAMRSALVGFGGRGTEAFLRISLRSGTLRAFLTRGVLECARGGVHSGTHSLDSIVDLCPKAARRSVTTCGGLWVT